MGKAGGGTKRVEINLVMSEQGPMQQASISEATHANYGNPTVKKVSTRFLEMHILPVSDTNNATCWRFLQWVNSIKTRGFSILPVVFQQHAVLVSVLLDGWCWELAEDGHGVCGLKRPLATSRGRPYCASSVVNEKHYKVPLMDPFYSIPVAWTI